jgi:hypothetical protein
VLGHEVDDLGRDLLGRDAEVAFVLAITSLPARMSSIAASTDASAARVSSGGCESRSLGALLMGWGASLPSEFRPDRVGFRRARGSQAGGSGRPYQRL